MEQIMETMLIIAILILFGLLIFSLYLNFILYKIANDILINIKNEINKAKRR